MYPNKGPRTSGRKTATKHHRSSIILYSGIEVLLRTTILLFLPNHLKCLILKCSIFVSYNPVPVKVLVESVKLQTLDLHLGLDERIDLFLSNLFSRCKSKINTGPLSGRCTAPLVVLNVLIMDMDLFRHVVFIGA